MYRYMVFLFISFVCFIVALPAMATVKQERKNNNYYIISGSDGPKELKQLMESKDKVIYFGHDSDCILACELIHQQMWEEADKSADITFITYYSQNRYFPRISADYKQFTVASQIDGASHYNIAALVKTIRTLPKNLFLTTDFKQAVNLIHQHKHVIYVQYSPLSSTCQSGFAIDLIPLAKANSDIAMVLFRNTKKPTDFLVRGFLNAKMTVDYMDCSTYPRELNDIVKKLKKPQNNLLFVENDPAPVMKAIGEHSKVVYLQYKPVYNPGVRHCSGSLAPLYMSQTAETYPNVYFVVHKLVNEDNGVLRGFVNGKMVSDTDCQGSYDMTKEIDDVAKKVNDMK